MDSIKKLLQIALIAALALSIAGCGRDDRQEKAANAASKKDSAAAASSGTASTKGPLQTGETDPSKAAELPDGTKSGARTTPNPK
jgi:Flp pilus assembly protein TadD